MNIESVLKYFTYMNKSIENNTGKTWITSIMEKHELSLLDLKSMILQEQKMTEKTSKIYYMLFQSHRITLIAFFIFLFVSFSSFSTLGGWGTVMGFIFCIYYLYADNRIKQYRIQKYVLDATAAETSQPNDK